MNLNISDYEYVICFSTPLCKLEVFSKSYIGKVCLVSNVIDGFPLIRTLYGHSVLLAGVFIRKELKPRFLVHRDSTQVFYSEYDIRLRQGHDPWASDMDFEQSESYTLNCDDEYTDSERRLWKVGVNLERYKVSRPD